MFPAVLAIFLLGCLHEDLAILAAGYFAIEHGLSPWLVGGLAYGGMLVNNVLLYCLGVLLRKHSWMRRWMLNKHALTIRGRLEQHLAITLTVARFGHSILMPTLVACGSLRVPIQRVLPAIALSAALYLALLLTIVIMLGEAVMRDLGNWAWVVPMTLAVGVGLWIVRGFFAQIEDDRNPP
jgi:membrane protein DedA with SNARE-associated domain